MTVQKKFLPGFILLLLTIVSGFLLFINLNYFAASDLLTFEENVTIIHRNPLATLGLCLLFAAICIAIYLVADKTSGKILLIVYILVSLGMLGGCIKLVRMSPYPPDADQYLIWHMANYLAGYEDGMPFSYIPYYWEKIPRQRPTVVLLSWFIRILHRGGEYYFRLLNAALYPLFCLGIKKLSDAIFESKALSLLSFFLTVCYLPTYFYVTYVYGTIISMVAIVWGLFFFISFFKTTILWQKAVFLLACIIISIIGNVFYMPTLIAAMAMAAFLLTVFLGNLRKDETARHHISRLLLGTGIILAIFGGTSGVDHYCQDYFGKYTGIDNAKGMPTTGWILMGISEENGVNGPGSYSGIIDFIYADNNYDPDKTAEAVNKQIIQVCKEYISGERSLQFFFDKEVIQWTDPWFASLTMTIYPDQVEDADIPDPWNIFISGDTLPLMERIFSIILPAVIMMALIGCLALWRETIHSSNSIYWCLPAFYIVGGFVFQLFWESKSRYCMPYFMMMIPFAAYGCRSIAKQFSHR